MWIGLVLSLLEGVVLESLERVLDISRHGYVHFSCFVLPFQGKSAIFFAVLILGYFVMLHQCVH